LSISDEEHNLNVREYFRKQAKENIEANARYDKRRFDKAKIIKYNVGDHVLLKNEAHHQTKLDLKFKSPI